MDNATLLINAIVAGAAARLQSDVDSSIVDGYDALRSLIRERCPDVDLAGIEVAPDSTMQRREVADALKKSDAADDSELTRLAEQLLALIRDHAPALLDDIDIDSDDDEALNNTNADDDDATRFDQRNQHVGTQYNAAGDINVQTGDAVDVDTGGGPYIAGDVNAKEFVAGDKIVQGDEVHGDKVAGDKVEGDKVKGDKIIIYGEQSSRPPGREELLSYLDNVRSAYSKWADQPDEPTDPAPERPGEADVYVPLDAKPQPLPMRMAEFQQQPGAQDPQAQELLTAIGDNQYTLILGEPGSGKTTALERLAWVTAQRSLDDAANGDDTPLTIPALARLAEYQGGADLLHVVNRALIRGGLSLNNDASLRALLSTEDMHFTLLLDGINELPRDQTQQGMNAIDYHIEQYRGHTVHLTCRTADFDELWVEKSLPDSTQLWTVQPLVDEIAFWHDTENRSDVREYLRESLGPERGKQLWDRLHADDRMRTMALIPLFLWMFKETASDGDGDLPNNRGALVQDFVNSGRIWEHVPQDLRARAQRTLTELAWRMQDSGQSDTDDDTLYAVLKRIRGPREYSLDTMRAYLQRTGLLVSLGDERWRLMHDIVREHGAASYLSQQPDCEQRLPVFARDEWHREFCIIALWLSDRLKRPDYLLSIMGDATVDLRVRVAAAEVLAEIGDPRFESRTTPAGVQVIEPDMVTIPDGEAILGGEDPEGDNDELPQCTVQVAAFEIARYPVTNAEFRCFVEAGGYDDESLWTDAGQAWLRGEAKLDPDTDQQLRSFYQNFSRDVEAWIAKTKRTQSLSDEEANNYRLIAANWTEDEYVNAYAQQVLSDVRREPYYWHDSRYNGTNQPVVGINWFEAMAYAEWLAKATGKGYRLLTEAEWEWAARRNERRYPWGDNWEPDRCNWSGSRLNRGSPVGVYPHGTTPNDNVHDLGGNVYEWTLSLYRPYEYVPDDGRENPEAEGLRVLRGGSWYGESRWVRCACRDGDDATGDGDGSGMRLARTLSQ